MFHEFISLSINFTAYKFEIILPLIPSDTAEPFGCELRAERLVAGRKGRRDEPPECLPFQFLT